MKFRSLAAVSTCLATVAAAPAAVINVPGDKPTIQAAINAAVAGDVVLIADGTYTGADNKNLDFGGKIITVSSASNDPTLCIIDCQGVGHGFDLGVGLTPEAVVAGLSIINGVGAIGTAGGFVIQDGAPTIRDCIVEDCTGSSGAAVNIDTADPQFIRCVFRNNVATGSGGAVVTFNSDATFERCVFVGNSGSNGGAVSTESPLVFTHCRFLGNSATGGGTGGAIASTDGVPQFINCEFNGNTGNLGAGLFIASGAMLSQCTITENEASSDGGGVYFSNFGSSELLIANSIVWNNGPTDVVAPDKFGATLIRNSVVATTDVINSLAPLNCSTCLNGNPTFVDADGVDNVIGTEDDDTRLLVTSNAIDAGADFFLGSLETDLAGNERVAGLSVDIGAFEFGSTPPATACLADFTGPGGLPDGMVGIDEFLAVLALWGACP